MKIDVIIPAAGSGKRFGEIAANGASKIEMDLAGKPVFLHSVQLFHGRPDVGQVIIAVNPDLIDDFRFRWGDKLGFLGINVVPGGTKERWETVMKAMEAVSDGATHIAVHDAARPMGSKAMIDRIFDAASRHAAVIPGLPVPNTLKRVTDAAAGDAPADPLDAILGDAGKPAPAVKAVVETVDRSDLVEVQTPQVFEANLLRKAYQQIVDGALDPAKVTDDASLVEALGETVMVVDGESTNFKITTPPDAELAGAIMGKRTAATAATLAKKRLFLDEDED